MWVCSPRPRLSHVLIGSFEKPSVSPPAATPQPIFLLPACARDTPAGACLTWRAHLAARLARQSLAWSSRNPNTCASARRWHDAWRPERVATVPGCPAPQGPSRIDLGCTLDGFGLACGTLPASIAALRQSVLWSFGFAGGRRVGLMACAPLAPRTSHSIGTRGGAPGSRSRLFHMSAWRRESLALSERLDGVEQRCCARLMTRQVRLRLGMERTRCGGCWEGDVNRVRTLGMCSESTFERCLALV